MTKPAASAALAAAMLLSPLALAPAHARVTSVTVGSPAALFSGRDFGAGAYEQIRGTARGELDPFDPHNAVITDILLAPRNASGKVEYTATFTLYKPVDMARASGVLVYEVVNRGNTSGVCSSCLRLREARRLRYAAARAPRPRAGSHAS